MISKNELISVFVIIMLCYFFTASKTNGQPIVDINGLVIIENVNGEVFYVKENGERIRVYSKTIEFNGGKDSLSAYLGKKYINHPDYNYTDYNMLETFFVLFDEKLNIVEVRIMKRPHNEKFYYDSIFIDALKSTKGMWYKIVENKEWYYYMHRQRVY